MVACRSIDSKPFCCYSQLEGLPVVMVTILKDYVKLSFSTNSARAECNAYYALVM